MKKTLKILGILAIVFVFVSTTIINTRGIHRIISDNADTCDFYFDTDTLVIYNRTSGYVKYSNIDTIKVGNTVLFPVQNNGITSTAIEDQILVADADGNAIGSNNFKYFKNGAHGGEDSIYFNGSLFFTGLLGIDYNNGRTYFSIGDKNWYINYDNDIYTTGTLGTSGSFKIKGPSGHNLFNVYGGESPNYYSTVDIGYSNLDIYLDEENELIVIDATTLTIENGGLNTYFTEDSLSIRHPVYLRSGALISGNTTLEAETDIKEAYSTPYQITTTSGSVTMNCDNGNNQYFTITGNVTAFTISNADPGGTYTLLITQGATGYEFDESEANFDYKSNESAIFSESAYDRNLFTIYKDVSGSTYYSITTYTP